MLVGAGGLALLVCGDRPGRVTPAGGGVGALLVMFLAPCLRGKFDPFHFRRIDHE